MKKLSFLFIFFAPVVLCAQPYTRNSDATPGIQFPDIPGYLTLKCDLHTHSVFSDGTVWPTVRVQEALAEGLDVLAMTDHVEYHPHKDQVPIDDLASTQLVNAYAKGKPIILIPGGEMSATPDHFNALFITDQSDTLLDNKDPEIRIRAAKKQGGFIFWNHPGWTARAKDGNAPVDERFYRLMEQGYINGIELCNGLEFWPEVLGLIQKYNLTLIGNSDIHGPSRYANLTDEHRTVTLVFAKEKSAESVREALEHQRTVVYANNFLVGDQQWLKELFQSSLRIETTYQKGTTLAVMKITNISDLSFRCRNLGELNFHNSAYAFELPAHATTTLIVRTNQPVDTFNLDLVVDNLITGPRESLRTILPVNIQNL